MKKSFEDFLLDVEQYKLKGLQGISEKKLRVAYSYANGCGVEGGVYVPDTIYGVCITPACMIHDMLWHLSTCYQDLVDADDDFPTNQKRITDVHSNFFTGYFRRLRIATYSYGVDFWGIYDYARKRGFIL